MIEAAAAKDTLTQAANLINFLKKDMTARTEPIRHLTQNLNGATQACHDHELSQPRRQA